jgi:hypothetical protein
MTTPESKIKIKVKEILHIYNCYWFCPVQMGIGAAGLDFHCYVTVGDYAIAFFIETKRYGLVPTPRQQNLIDFHELKKARCFVVDNEGSLQVLERWLQEVRGCSIKSNMIF